MAVHAAIAQISVEQTTQRARSYRIISLCVCVCAGSHLDKQLLEILLELLRVSGDGHGADICGIVDVYHQRSHTETFNVNKNKSGASLMRDARVAQKVMRASKYSSQQLNEGLGLTCLDFFFKTTTT